MPDPTQPPCRFPPPWTVEETAPCFIVRDANDQALAFVYCEDEPDGRRATGKLLTRDEARRIAANIAKLPELLKRQSQRADPERQGPHHGRVAAERCSEANRWKVSGSTSAAPPHTSQRRRPLPWHCSQAPRMTPAKDLPPEPPQTGQEMVLWPWHLGHKILVGIARPHVRPCPAYPKADIIYEYTPLVTRIKR
jgi:hypothetical protein